MGLSLEVVMGNQLTAVEIAHEANARGFTVIVSRGTTARLMDGAAAGTCGQVQVTGYDAVRALTRPNVTQTMGIVGSDDMIRWVGSLDGVLGGKVSAVAESWDDTCGHHVFARRVSAHRRMEPGSRGAQPRWDCPSCP